MADAPSLAAVQRWMQEALLDPSGTRPDAMVTASRRQSARERLFVYQHGYRQRLVECMRSLHPGSVRLLGEEIFDGFALDYLAAHPSRSPLLAGLSDGFADHLARTRPDAGPGAEREPWIDLLIDLVHFERAFVEVLDGPGPEDGAGPAPPARLLRACAPVHAYLAAVHRGEDPEPPPPAPVFLALRRRDYAVVTRELSRAAYERLLRARATPQT
ncbi:DNA-binding domain-containing protein [Streptomyces luteireticuli]|uniref:Putative DNA-binding domain-containing protein n=1 Tax=Streptomyces luteireticuli TaxID=173858 RepID=A0ABP3IMS3_9ACTN